MRRPTPTRQPASAGRFEFRELVSKSKSHHWPARRGFVRLPHAALRLRLPLRRTKPLRGGKDLGLVHKPSASATRPIDSDLAPCLYQRAAPCYSSAWLRLAAASVRFFTSRSPGTLPRTRPLPIYSIYIIKAKAVPVAASSSEIASARPTGPEFRPRSFTALRIQHSSKHAWFATTEGTPQGGTVSPALANWTLDGLQRLLAEHFANTPQGQGKSKVHLVRYADDFLITGTSKALLRDQVQPLVAHFLKERGLELSH